MAYPIGTLVHEVVSWALAGVGKTRMRLGARANGLVRSRVGGRCMRYRTSGIVATIVSGM